MKIIGIDPGVTTGIAIYNDGNWTKEHLIGDHFDKLWKLLEQEQPDVIVCESFIKRNNPGADTTPLQYIGLVKSFCEINNVKLVLQTPSHGKAFWTDKKLKACGLYATGFKHSMDAIRHILLYLTNTKTLPQEYLDLLRQRL